MNRELLDNAEDFLKSGEENLEKKRFNVAITDFFKAIVILCDYLIYREIKILPKNHSERFLLLRRHFREIYEKVSELFSFYIRSYTFKLKRAEVLKTRAYAYEIKKYIYHKK